MSAHALLQDFTGVPVVVDLACMHDAMNNLDGHCKIINHFLRIAKCACGSCGPSFGSSDVSTTENAVKANTELEFQRNQ
ncbi:aconitate hydratase 1, partial [Tanacetum coccineum]